MERDQHEYQPISCGSRQNCDIQRGRGGNHANAWDYQDRWGYSEAEIQQVGRRCINLFTLYILKVRDLEKGSMLFAVAEMAVEQHDSPTRTSRHFAENFAKIFTEP